MPHERYFIDHQTDYLEGKEHHHLKNVMRTKIGQMIELVDGKGTLSQAKVEKIGKSRTELTLLHSEKRPPPPFELTLAQAIPRIGRLDTIIEKGTELGATTFWLFAGEESERKELTESSLKRLTQVSIAALKQCGRLWLPKLIIKPSIKKWPPPSSPLFFGDLRQTRAAKIPKLEKAILVIGPEKGLTENEIAHLEEIGGEGILLHQNTLRTDTAAIAAMALFSRENDTFTKN